MQSIRVYFEDKNGIKNIVETQANGTPGQISTYYLDKYFNFPDYEDKNGIDCYKDHYYKGVQVDFFN